MSQQKTVVITGANVMNQEYTAHKPFYNISAVEFLALLSDCILPIVLAITCNTITQNHQKLL